MALLIGDADFDIDAEIDLFKRIFDFLANVIGDSAFKKYNPEKDKFEGPFSNTSFEAVLVGIAENLEALQDKDVFSMITNVLGNDVHNVNILTVIASESYDI